jgi:Ca2+-binding RTX toxin-like protein
MRIKLGVLIGVLTLTPVFLAAPSQAAAPTCKGVPATIVGTVADDEFVGTPLTDVVWLGPGNDKFTDLGGNDVICGGRGNDSIGGGDGSDYIQGDGGKDEISGEAGDDRILGGTGNDAITPGDGDDTVRGGKGDDYFAEGAGSDRIVGGKHKDFVTYLFFDGSIRVRNAQDAFGAGHDVLAVETIEGTARADVMRGSDGDDDLRGGGGDDRIYGLGGNDVLFASGGVANAGPGVDFIQATGRTTANGGADSDQIVLGKGPVQGLGGPGTDQFKVSAPGFTGSADGQGDANQLDFSVHKRAVTVNIGTGRASWKGGRMTFKNIDNTLGTVRADTMIGSAGNDYMDAGRGRDNLRGLGGNDFLIGRGGFDRADGGPGWDICLTEARLACP